jgi:hypothetical protein
VKVPGHLVLDEVGGIRASVQRGLIAAALHGVLAAPATSIAVIAVTFSVATGTAARRNPPRRLGGLGSARDTRVSASSMIRSMICAAFVTSLA